MRQGGAGAGGEKMITVRLEYSGMRAERSARDIEHAREQAVDMFARHGIDRTTMVGDEYWRGRVRVTGARAIVRFIDESKSAGVGTKVIDGLGRRGTVVDVTPGTPHDTLRVQYADGHVTPWYRWAITLDN